MIKLAKYLIIRSFVLSLKPAYTQDGDQATSQTNNSSVVVLTLDDANISGSFDKTLPFDKYFDIKVANIIDDATYIRFCYIESGKSLTSCIDNNRDLDMVVVNVSSRSAVINSIIWVK